MKEETTTNAEEEIATYSGKEEDPLEIASDDSMIENKSEDAEALDNKPETDLEILESELASKEDKYIRLVAEFTNYRRRVGKEMSGARHKGQADLLSGFLEVLDDLERVGVTEKTEYSVKFLIEGIEMVERKFKQVLDASGVEMIDPCGEIFNPNAMEAMVTVPTDLPEEDGQVCEVFQKGYRLGDQLLRAAQVSVLKEK
jgi:molecular chaperone GrpE